MVFLEAVADRFVHHGALDRVCFVFPNRRSGTFFKRWLGIRAGRPVFVPNVLTIDELFARIAGIDETPEKVRLLDILYREYLPLMPPPEGKEPETFDEFLYWGDILLRDFDDLDKYRIDVRRLLVNLRDLKALSADYDFLTDDQKAAIAAFCNSFFAGEMPGQAGHDGGQVPGGSRHKFAEIWDILYPLYERFRAALTAEGLAYAGMIYRSVADSLPTAGEILPQFDTFVFVGLNALNACEKALLDHLRKEGRADFYWDFSGPMVTDPENPAGRFLRENEKRYPTKKPFQCPARDPQTQHFEVIRVPSAVGQTRKAMQILEDLQQQGALAHPEETAVILPDENLLFPMLGAVPEAIGKVNVTMGYSLSASSGAMLFQLLERLQADARQRNESWNFYHRDVVDLMEHPYFAAAADAEQIAGIKAGIRAENRIFIPAAELAAFGGLFALVFRPVEHTADLPAYLKGILEMMQESQTPLEREFLYYFHKAVSELESVGLDPESLEPKTWFRLLSQAVALIKIPFEGEPLSGLQVMGPLETRALDFRNVIMLSVGEGTFPSRTVSASFIPYNLRVGFGLPTYELQDSIWAYYFYRSICRAERIYLIYDSRTEGLQSGEESRYIKQLKYLYEVPLVEKVATYALSASGIEAQLPRIEKTPAVREELAQRYFVERHAFSASALNKYLDCPLRFYYEYVKGIKEPDEVTESLDADMFGSIYHKVMEELYKPLIGGELLPDTLRAMKRDKRRIDGLLDAAFAQQHITDIAGQNLILRDLILHFVLRTLEVDAQLGASAPLILKGTETKVYNQLTLSGGQKVSLIGFIDHMDSPEPGVVRVVDYKSGVVDKKDDCRDVSKLFDGSLAEKRPSVAFQLYFYALMMTQGHSGAPVRYDPCVYSLREFFATLPEAKQLKEDALAEYGRRLTGLAEEILLSDKPFLAAESANVCKFCQFKRLCNRR